jgi:hypothetical protein
VLHVVNALGWCILTGIGVSAYQAGELDAAGETALVGCAGLFVWNVLAAVYS